MASLKTAAYNISICAIVAEKYRPSSFGILLSLSNLAVTKQKVTAKQVLGILFPQQHKCLAVACNFYDHLIDKEFHTLMKYLDCVLVYLILIAFIFLDCTSRSNKNLRNQWEKEASEANESGNYFKSIYYYSKLISMDSSTGVYYFGRGYSYLKLAKIEPSEKDFFKINKIKLQT
jgi:tetratricopeptide (TPR) repeat protein